MRHRTALTAVALGAALAATALSGCSSDSSGKKSDDAKAPSTGTSTGTAAASGGSSAPSDSSSPPAKPARKVSGHLDFTGAASGGADFSGGVVCEVKNGKLIGVTTPDVLAKKQIFPSFIATTADSPTQVALFNTPDGTSYSGRVPKSQGVTAKKSGGTWTVTVDGLQIAKDYSGAGAVVTLKGSLTCTRVS
ncbi:hypothetical protein [Streptomyces sp. NRRL F-5123]|uniref:hypothetical protein n=1 Tax=Streptomyces sp. NRRL F-5123 TaxID=1463856 RepID=UPI0004E266A9|nr:hypothetical protein [Streptomyces sp. NRRL F-5123]